MTTQVKHTAGPWRVGDDDFNSENAFISAGKDYLQLATIHAIHGKREAEANAQLIASAPELLEACKEALKYFDQIDFRGANARQLTKAIAKAEGD